MREFIFLLCLMLFPTSLLAGEENEAGSTDLDRFEQPAGKPASIFGFNWRGHPEAKRFLISEFGFALTALKSVDSDVIPDGYMNWDLGAMWRAERRMAVGGYVGFGAPVYTDGGRAYYRLTISGRGRYWWTERFGLDLSLGFVTRVGGALPRGVPPASWGCPMATMERSLCNSTGLDPTGTFTVGPRCCTRE